VIRGRRAQTWLAAVLGVLLLLAGAGAWHVRQLLLVATPGATSAPVAGIATNAVLPVNAPVKAAVFSGFRSVGNLSHWF
jgi:hypothetical protein